MNRFTRFLAGALCAATALSSSAAFVGDRTDFRDETIYFAMTTRFYDGDPTNNVLCWDLQNLQIANNDPCWRGDFKGLIDRLDYIKALGFTAIWITPIVQNASGYDYHGYHAMDFSKVDLRYESRKEWGASEDVTFKTLVDAAHAKQMKVILDVVLQHTGNFGENELNHLFTRNQNIRNQATPAGSLIPDGDKFPANYFDQEGKVQYEQRWKYFKNPQYEPNNYYHHYGTGWNWDLPNRWWGQIAGDCVDLNTENDYVADYIVRCFGTFIRMGVDGFRIDTSGHIAPLTFNKQFIPEFIKISEEPDVKKLRNGCPFFMFGEVCQRFQGSVVYRDQPNLSSYFYTWKSDQSLLDQYDGNAAWWRQQNLPEGHDSPVGPMALCEKDTKDKPTSDNVFLKNGQWHDPDYSQASGLNVIDFPMHYSFNDAGSAVAVAKMGDNKYNDASFNVVYVDSHDYCPGPNDGMRFNGGTAQWAENLSLMFTFRGIPCIYYGSEVEFQAGKPVDNYGSPMKDGGRAYFGAYLEGTVSADDFGKYSATGNVSKTLDGDLAHHLRRLNQIRAAVPALRKGQYTFDGCSAKGGWAFKRAYKNESYVLVAINGGATFSNVPAGKYTDIVTGKKYDGGGTITVDAPTNKGQLRVLVKDWNGDKDIVGEDGKFIYNTAAVAHGGSPQFSDPGTTHYYKPEDVVGNPGVALSPAGGTFNTEKLTVTASLNEVAVSGWYQIGTAAKVALTPGQSTTFTVGQDMQFGQSVTVNWGAKGAHATEYTGSAVYKKVDPNASITVYVKAPQGTNMYAWGKNSAGADVKPCGEWPGKTLSEATEINGVSYYYVTFDDMDAVNVIFNKDGSQTPDISGISEDTFYEYDGATNAKKIDVNVTPVPTVKFSPNGGQFVGTVNVTVTVANANTAWYQIGNGGKTAINGSSATFTLGNGMADGESVTVAWGAVGTNESRNGSVVFTKVAKPVEPDGLTVYYDNSVTNWSKVMLHYWGAEETTWPGVEMVKANISGYANIYRYTVPTGTVGLVFNNGNGDQTNDVTNISNGMVIRGKGNREFENAGFVSGTSLTTWNDDQAPVEFYNLQGMKVDAPTPGMYIMRQGNRVKKVIVR